MEQRTGSITEMQRSGFVKQSLRQCLYLLQKSFNRCGKLKKSGTSDILVDAEKILIRRRLSFLFNIGTDIRN
jgi:hypothetical protein